MNIAGFPKWAAHSNFTERISWVGFPIWGSPYFAILNLGFPTGIGLLTLEDDECNIVTFII